MANNGFIKSCINRKTSFADSDAVAYVWIVWEKGYKGKTELEWLE